jgi:CBS domain containing-hemolysin-like protein
LEGTAADHLQPVLKLENTMRLEVALRKMQRAGQRLAAVTGPDQTEIGVVSLQDILRFLFGEVRL